MIRRWLHRPRVLAVAVTGAIAAVVLPAAGALTGPAEVRATTPGANGLIAFTPFGRTASQIYTVAPDGTGQRALTNNPSGSFDPDWSPDGHTIAFARRGARGKDEVFSMAADGTGIRQLTRDCPRACLGRASPSYSPDGRQITLGAAYRPLVRLRVFDPQLGRAHIQEFASRVTMLVMNADGSGMRTVHTWLLRRDGREPVGASQWSPDGRLLALSLSNTRAQPQGRSAIYTLKPDGSGLRRITAFRLNAGDPDWSPDGTLIVFQGGRTGFEDLYTVRPDGGGLRQITHGTGENFRNGPGWSPDSTRVTYTRRRQDQPVSQRYDIWTMNADGSDEQQVTTSPLSEGSADWGTALPSAAGVGSPP